MSNGNTPAPNTNENQFEPASPTDNSPPRMVPLSDIINGGPTRFEPLDDSQPIEVESDTYEEESDSSDEDYLPSEAEETIRISTIPLMPPNHPQRGTRRTRGTARMSVRMPQVEIFTRPSSTHNRPFTRNVRRRTTDVGETSNPQSAPLPTMSSPVTQRMHLFDQRITQIQNNNVMLTRQMDDHEQRIIEAYNKVRELNQRVEEYQQRVIEAEQRIAAAEERATLAEERANEATHRAETIDERLLSIDWEALSRVADTMNQGSLDIEKKK